MSLLLHLFDEASHTAMSEFNGACALKESTGNLGEK